MPKTTPSTSSKIRSAAETSPRHKMEASTPKAKKPKGHKSLRRHSTSSVGSSSCALSLDNEQQEEGSTLPSSESEQNEASKPCQLPEIHAHRPTQMTSTHQTRKGERSPSSSQSSSAPLATETKRKVVNEAIPTKKRKNRRPPKFTVHRPSQALEIEADTATPPSEDASSPSKRGNRFRRVQSSPCMFSPTMARKFKESKGPVKSDIAMHHHLSPVKNKNSFRVQDIRHQMQLLAHEANAAAARLSQRKLERNWVAPLAPVPGEREALREELDLKVKKDKEDIRTKLQEARAKEAMESSGASLRRVGSWRGGGHGGGGGGGSDDIFATRMDESPSAKTARARLRKKEDAFGSELTSAEPTPRNAQHPASKPFFLPGSDDNDNSAHNSTVPHPPPLGFSPAHKRRTHAVDGGGGGFSSHEASSSNEMEVSCGADSMVGAMPTVASSSSVADGQGLPSLDAHKAFRPVSDGGNGAISRAQELLLQLDAQHASTREILIQGEYLTGTGASTLLPPSSAKPPPGVLDENKKMDAQAKKRAERLLKEKERLEKLDAQIKESKRVRREAAIVVQQFARATVAAKTAVRKEMEERCAPAVLTAQRCWRRIAAIKKARDLRKLRDKRIKKKERAELRRAASTAIQKMWRGYRARKNLPKHKKQRALKIRKREQAELKKAMATEIQRMWRGYAGRKEAKRVAYDRLCGRQATVIQCAWRTRVAKVEFNTRRTERRAAVKIQCAFRQKRARKELLTRREARAALLARRRKKLAAQHERARKALEKKRKAINDALLNGNFMNFFTDEERAEMCDDEIVVEKSVKKAMKFHLKMEQRGLASAKATMSDYDALKLGFMIEVMNTKKEMAEKGQTPLKKALEADGVNNQAATRRGSFAKRNSNAANNKANNAAAAAAAAAHASKGSKPNSGAVTPRNQVQKKRVGKKSMDPEAVQRRRRDRLTMLIAPLVELLVRDTDQQGTSVTLLNSLLREFTPREVDWLTIIDREHLLMASAIDGSVTYFDTFLRVQGLKLTKDDALELVIIALGNPAKRLKFAETIMRREFPLRLFESVEDMAPVWQNFFVNTASQMLVTPQERNDPQRLMVLGDVFTHHNIRVSIKEEGEDGYSVVSRACMEGDLEFLTMLRRRDKERLLSALTHINAVDGYHPLVHALIADQPESLKWVLQFQEVVDMIEHCCIPVDQEDAEAVLTRRRSTMHANNDQARQTSKASGDDLDQSQSGLDQSQSMLDQSQSGLIPNNSVTTEPSTAVEIGFQIGTPAATLDIIASCTAPLPDYMESSSLGKNSDLTPSQLLSSPSAMPEDGGFEDYSRVYGTPESSAASFSAHVGGSATSSSDVGSAQLNQSQQQRAAAIRRKQQGKKQDVLPDGTVLFTPSRPTPAAARPSVSQFNELDDAEMDQQLEDDDEGATNDDVAAVPSIDLTAPSVRVEEGRAIPLDMPLDDSAAPTATSAAAAAPVASSFSLFAPPSSLPPPRAVPPVATTTKSSPSLQLPTTTSDARPSSALSELSGASDDSDWDIGADD